MIFKVSPTVLKNVTKKMRKRQEMQFSFDKLVTCNLGTNLTLTPIL